ncbi:hypothetical protein Tco_0539588 [Tanacetum coccineum]
MANLKFTDTHNMVAFLSKPEESDGFEQIVDFLNAHPIKYALTVNPTIYISCIEQFWSTIKAKIINGEVQLHALVDGKKVIITEVTVRRDLQLEDEEGVDCLPNSTIFEQLTLMGYEKISQKLTFYKAFFSPQWKFLIHTILQCLSLKTTAWNECSSTMASAIICLAKNQKFNFSKYIFESMVRNLDNLSRKFLMYLRFVSNYAGQNQMGKGSAMPTDPQHTPTFIQSSPPPQKTQKPRKPKRKDTQVLDLEKTKTTQANKIASLKRRVKKLEPKKRSRTHGLKRLRKVGFYSLVLDGDEVFAEQEVVLKLAASASIKVSAAQKTTATILTPRKGIVITELAKIEADHALAKDCKQEETKKVLSKMFDRAFKRVNTFVDFRTYLVEDEVAIDVVPLATKSPSIIDWKIHKEGKKSYYQIVKVDGKSQMYKVFSQMLKSFTKEDLEDQYKLVKAKYDQQDQWKT